MAEVLIIHLKNLLVVDEHISYIAYFLPVGFCNTMNPIGCLSLFDMGELHPF
jgi:hypothetical protein